MKKKQKPLPTPTEAQFLALNQAYQYFNQELFDGTLPGCILNFSRKRNTHGFMAANRWRKVAEEEYSTHEISLTPTTLYREPILVFSTLYQVKSTKSEVQSFNRLTSRNLSEGKYVFLI